VFNYDVTSTLVSKIGRVIAHFDAPIHHIDDLLVDDYLANILFKYDVKFYITSFNEKNEIVLSIIYFDLILSSLIRTNMNESLDGYELIYENKYSYDSKSRVISDSLFIENKFHSSIKYSFVNDKISFVYYSSDNHTETFYYNEQGYLSEHHFVNSGGICTQEKSMLTNERITGQF
jgi:hypothetical protein